MNVLIVDDEGDVLRTEVRILESTGHVCFAAGSSEEALEILGREAIDVAVLDVRLPGESGLTLARTMQTGFPLVGVVMVTGAADYSTVTDARLAGAVDYITKPVTVTALVAAVDRADVVRQRRAGHRPPAIPTADPATPVSAVPSVPPRSRVSGVSASPLSEVSPLSEAASLSAVSRLMGAQLLSSANRPIDRLFRLMCSLGASDLHLSTGVQPLVRIDGKIVALERNAAALTSADLVHLLNPIVPDKNRQEFAERHDSDFAYEIDGLARFRANIFVDRNGTAAVFRAIPTRIMTAEQLGLSPAVIELCEMRKGLVLVTGPTGSGKSTTLAALVDYVNRTRSDHIVTIEDPIEFIHANQGCLINQREVHSHTESFRDALRAALREDPDVVLIGEMRDLETTAIALETAETGHLVFGTLHTTTAVSTIDRIIDQFPADRQPQIRVMLSESLRGVIAQSLCRKIGGGRVAALEVLLVTTAISNLIREHKTFQIPSLMQVGRAAGMVTLNDALFDLVRSGTVSAEEALTRTIDKAGFTAMLARTGPTAGQPA